MGSESLAGLSGSESRTSVLLSPHGQSSRKINCKAKTRTEDMRQASVQESSHPDSVQLHSRTEDIRQGLSACRTQSTLLGAILQD